MTWLVLAAFVGLIWFVYRQANEAGAARWRLRMDLHFRPIGRLLREDVRATKQHFQNWRGR